MRWRWKWPGGFGGSVHRAVGPLCVPEPVLLIYSGQHRPSPLHGPCTIGTTFRMKKMSLGAPLSRWLHWLISEEVSLLTWKRCCCGITSRGGEECWLPKPATTPGRGLLWPERWGDVDLFVQVEEVSINLTPPFSRCAGSPEPLLPQGLWRQRMWGRGCENCSTTLWTGDSALKRRPNLTQTALPSCRESECNTNRFS